MFSNASDRTFNKLLEYPGIKLFVRVFNNFFVSNLNQSLIAGNTLDLYIPLQTPEENDTPKTTSAERFGEFLMGRNSSD